MNIRSRHGNGKAAALAPCREGVTLPYLLWMTVQNVLRQRGGIQVEAEQRVARLAEIKKQLAMQNDVMVNYVGGVAEFGHAILEMIARTNFIAKVPTTFGVSDYHEFGNHVLGIQRTLVAAGFESGIIVESADPRLEHLTMDYRDAVTGIGEDDLLIHHFSIGSRASRTAYALPCRMMLVYHNITPPEYFLGVHPWLARQCFHGRRELLAYRSRVEVAAGASPFNPALAANGEKLFQTKGCTVCHSFGKKVTCPDLVGVTTRRTARWLEEQILHPEVMVKEDPISHALKADFPLPMTNQGLKPEEAKAVIEFLKKKDRDTSGSKPT